MGLFTLTEIGYSVGISFLEQRLLKTEYFRLITYLWAPWIFLNDEQGLKDILSHGLGWITDES